MSREAFTYLTAFPPGKEHLLILGSGLRENEMNTWYKGLYPGGAAMVPKRVLRASEETLKLLGDLKIEVIRAQGEDVIGVARRLRDKLGYRTEDMYRVHIAGTPAEIKLIQMARTRNSAIIVRYILRCLTMEDLA